MRNYNKIKEHVLGLIFGVFMITFITAILSSMLLQNTGFSGIFAFALIFWCVFGIIRYICKNDLAKFFDTLE